MSERKEERDGLGRVMESNLCLQGIPRHEELRVWVGKIRAGPS